MKMKNRSFAMSDSDWDMKESVREYHCTFKIGEIVHVYEYY